MAIRMMYTAATPVPATLSAALPSGTISKPNLGNGGSDPQSPGIVGAAPVAAGTSDSLSALRPTNGQPGALPSAAAQSTISLSSFSPSLNHLATSELSISSIQPNEEERLSQPRSPSSRSEAGAVEEGGRAAPNPARASADPSPVTRPEAIVSQPTGGVLYETSARATINATGAPSSSNISLPATGQVPEVAPLSFAPMAALEAIQASVSANGSAPSGTVSVAPSTLVTGAVPPQTTETVESQSQTAVSGGNTANLDLPPLGRDTNAATIPSASAQTPAASFEILAKSGSSLATDGLDKNEAAAESFDAQPTAAPVFREARAGDVTRVNTIESFSQSNPVVGSAQEESARIAEAVRDASVQPSFTPRAPAPSPGSVARLEPGNGQAPIPMPVLPKLATASYTSGQSKETTVFAEQTNSPSSGTQASPDAESVPATTSATGEGISPNAPDALNIENSTPRGKLEAANSETTSSTTSATVSSNGADKTGKKSSSAVLPAVTLANAVPASPSSSGDAGANVSPAITSGKDAPAAAQAVPTPSAAIAAPPSASAGPAELPKSHQMLDSPTTTLPPAAGSGPNPAMDAQISGQMHVGIRTDAFGAVEIHTVVQHSQIGLTVHSDRDIARWFTSEVPGLEAGLNKSHLNLTGVDFQNSSQTSAGFQQGQSRQSFSQPQNSLSANAREALPEKESAAESLAVPLDILPSDGIRGKSETHVSIHV